MRRATIGSGRDRKPQIARALLIAAAASVGAARLAAAQDGAVAPPDHHPGACPEHEAVLAALHKLGARDDPDRLASMAVEAGLGVDDRGASFRVSVRGQTRDYDDAGRDCDRRARLAAVFAALVLAPDTAGTSGQAAPATPAAPVARAEMIVSPASTPPSAPSARWELGAGPAIAVAAHRGSALSSPGVAIGARRLAARWDVGLTFTVPMLAANFSIGGAAVQLARYPLRLAVGRAARLGVLRAAAEAGVLLSVLRVERTGPLPTVAETRLEPGAHLGAEVSFPTRRVSLYVAVGSDWIPRTYPLALDPEGAIDRTPALWFSGEAGLRLALH
jgi:hypothetical protein